MRIYISGIEGTGMGPLALMAKAAGFTVFGSDSAEGLIHDELIRAGIEVSLGEQDGEFLKSKLEEGVDWFCHTSALKNDHPELVLAREAGIKVTKRDDLTAFLVSELGLKMVAVAGTHGKTTTTAMIVFAALELGLPVSYIVGTTLGFAPSGAYHEGDKYFIYEADEYDRNFLKFQPWLSVIPAVSYDHPDIYPTEEDYQKAFEQFKSQSQKVIENSEKFDEGEFKLAGEARRKDASLAAEAVLLMIQDGGSSDSVSLVEILNKFPGVGRRFEKIADGVYTDYAHHPEEIAATVKVAKDEANILSKKGIVVVYQPHQNTRQHEVFSGYKDAFLGVDKLFWLPTYLTRENPELKVIEPREFIDSLSNSEIAETAELDDDLEMKLRDYLKDDYLVVLMTAGPADGWLREKLEG
ncbi:hypothetical protein IJH15_03490 [Candidatus Saccharibacteria bacterium]|nr:hypothetical protein [Candidatus Saccharibacteria bacterium]